MRARNLGVTCLTLLGLGVVALAMPWTRDMVSGPAVLPQERPMLPPPGVLSVDADVILDRLDAEERLTNPLPPSPQVLEQGQWLYDLYCNVCHGLEGRADGVVGEKHFSNSMPFLDTPYIQSYADGYMYSIIREGGYLMPGYAEVMSPTERWMLVHYLRTLADQ